jgi:phosphoserine phosphatase
MFFRADGPITTIGIGDSLNDLPMLNSVDLPISSNALQAFMTRN